MFETISLIALMLLMVLAGMAIILGAVTLAGSR